MLLVYHQGCRFAWRFCWCLSAVTVVIHNINRVHWWKPPTCKTKSCKMYWKFHLSYFCQVTFNEQKSLLTLHSSDLLFLGGHWTRWLQTVWSQPHLKTHTHESSSSQLKWITIIIIAISVELLSSSLALLTWRIVCEVWIWVTDIMSEGTPHVRSGLVLCRRELFIVLVLFNR